MYRSFSLRASLAIAVAVSSVGASASLFAQGQPPAVANQSADKLPVRLKAKLPDYWRSKGNVAVHRGQIRLRHIQS